MKILAIDTSTKMGSIALTDGETHVRELLLNIEITHAEKLLPAIQKILQEAKWDFSMIEGLSLAIGPGSFTGLRIGLATMKGFAQALNLPLVGVSSLMALAYNGSESEEPVVAVLEAGRGEVYAYAATFKDRKIDKIILEEQAIKSDLLSKTLGNYQRQIHARWVGVLGYRKLKRGEGKDWRLLTPNYLRKSDAEIKK